MPLFPFAVLLAGSCEKQPQSTLSVPVDEAHSDDSDDIVIVSPSLRMKKTSTHFFNGLWSWIIWFTNKGISTEVTCIKDEQRRNISLQLSAFFQLWMNTCLICHSTALDLLHLQFSYLLLFPSVFAIVYIVLLCMWSCKCFYLYLSEKGCNSRSVLVTSFSAYVSQMQVDYAHIRDNTANVWRRRYDAVCPVPAYITGLPETLT